MSIEFEMRSDFTDTRKWLSRLQNGSIERSLAKYGREGVEALRSATPTDSGKTAERWRYEISKSKAGTQISWFNDNVKDGVPIVVLLQYGHGQNHGGYVEGRDFINPAIQPIFDKIAEDAWKAVKP